MARPNKISKPILDGAVSLYLRNKTWHARFRIGKHIIRISTKQTEFERARQNAADAYMRAKYRDQEGLPAITTKSFRSLAFSVIADLEGAISEGRGKSVYRDYIEVLRRYHITYFANTAITSIGTQELKNFAEWREKEFGRVPAASTINTHNAALNRVFDYAVDKGFLSRSRVPELKNNGKRSTRRPDFTLDEYKLMMAQSLAWARNGRAGKIQWKRRVLRNYIHFVISTGVRPGTETAGLKWRHTRFVERDGKTYLAISVDGKTGRRELIARPNVIHVLKQLHNWNEKVKKTPIAELVGSKSDEYIFALPTGEEVKNLEAPFKALLEHCGLLEDKATGQPRTLYSLRHSYITFALLYRKTPIHLLAKQCGTSVAMIEAHYSHLTAVLAADQLG